MKARELIELNQRITDIMIEIRLDGTRLLDCLLIGLDVGRIPPNPRTVPKDISRIGSSYLDYNRRMAGYIEKSINARDDKKDYYQVKLDRIPKKWLDLEVYSWNVWPASKVGINVRSWSGFNGERLNLVCLPSGDDMTIKHPKQAEEKDDQIEGQTDIFDFIGGADDNT